MATVEITEKNFKDIYTSHDIVILDFWASWCGPCMSFAPIFEKASEKYPDVVFGKVNTEEEQDLAAHFEIRSIPTIMVIREQLEVFFQPGALPEDLLEELITKIKDLDMDAVKKQIEEEEKGSS